MAANALRLAARRRIAFSPLSRERLISHNVSLPAPVIVTGCAGFIGARVSQQLLAAGQPVIAGDYPQVI